MPRFTERNRDMVEVKRVMKRASDYFQAIYRCQDGTEDYIEGHWPGFPKGWETWSKEGRAHWLHELARDCGMPSDGIVLRFVLTDLL